MLTKKGGRTPNRNESAHNRHGDKPDETRDRTPARTNPHHTTNQTRDDEGEGSSARTRRKTAPDNRPRKRTRRRTQQPGTAATSQSQTNDTAEGNRNATNRRTRTNREGKTHHGKPPKGETTVLGWHGRREVIGASEANKKPSEASPHKLAVAQCILPLDRPLWGLGCPQI